MAQDNKETMQGEVTLTFKIKAGNVFDLKKKKETLEKFSRLDMEDQQRLEAIIDSAPARKGLKENWNMLKAMFGVK
jgi:hypothetical protein